MYHSWCSDSAGEVEVRAIYGRRVRVVHQIQVPKYSHLRLAAVPGVDDLHCLGVGAHGPSYVFHCAAGHGAALQSSSDVPCGELGYSLVEGFSSQVFSQGAEDSVTQGVVAREVRGRVCGHHTWIRPFQFRYVPVGSAVGDRQVDWSLLGVVLSDLVFEGVGQASSSPQVFSLEPGVGDLVGHDSEGVVTFSVHPDGYVRAFDCCLVSRICVLLGIFVLAAESSRYAVCPCDLYLGSWESHAQ